MTMLKPDVVTLDLEMPRMDGFTFLRILMSKQPTPVIIVSSLRAERERLQGARAGGTRLRDEAGPEDRARCPRSPRAAALEGARPPDGEAEADSSPADAPHAERYLLRRRHSELRWPPDAQVVGRLRPALDRRDGLLDGRAGRAHRYFGRIVKPVPAAFVVAQHMPDKFTRTFAERLAKRGPSASRRPRMATACSPRAASSALVGSAWRIVVNETSFFAKLCAPSSTDRYVPSGDRLLRTAAIAGPRCIGVVLTGMGDDGVEGARAIRNHGGIVIAESAETAVVYGMPGAVVRAGLATKELPLPQIAEYLRPCHDRRRVLELTTLGDEIVARAKRGGATVAECIVEAAPSSPRACVSENSELVEEAGHHAAGLRVMKGKRVASTSTSDLSPEGIARFVADALELAELSQEDPFAGPADPSLLSDPAAAPHLELFDRRAARSTRRRPSPSPSAASRQRAASTRASPTARARRWCTAVEWRRPVERLQRGVRGILCVAQRRPRGRRRRRKKRRGYHWTAKRFLDELDAPEAVGQEAARRTLRKLGARTVATCEAPVVFDPDAARRRSSLSSRALRWGARFGGSRATWWIARSTGIATDLVTVVDDPLILRAPGSRPFDGEGLASRRNVVVDKGMLRMFLCDSYSARKLGRASTGNASRGGGAGVGARTSNFVLEPGPTRTRPS